MAYLSTITCRSADAVKQILDMYLPDGGLIADVTWGKGAFWKDYNSEKYQVIGSDLVTEKDVIADFTRLPYRASIFDAVFLDPPWGNQGGENPGPEYAETKDRYGLSLRKLVSELVEQYAEGIWECKRVMKTNGILVVKCQDFVNSGDKHWIVRGILSKAAEKSLTAVDCLVQVAPGHPRMRHKGPQQHFRMNHSNYWIFKKELPKK